jgi:hypothetical protein
MSQSHFTLTKLSLEVARGCKGARVRVPKDIIWGHMGIWSDNSIAMFGALYRLHFPLTSEGKVAPSAVVRVPHEPDVQQLNQDKPR